MIKLRGTFLKRAGIAFAIILASLDLYAAKEQATLSKVRPGDTIYSLLKTYGFSEDQRRSSFHENVLPTNFVIAPGDIYKVIKNGMRTELRFFDRTLDMGYSFWREGKDAGSTKVPQKYVRKISVAEGKVNGSLIESIVKQVGDELVAYRFMDAYLLDYKLPKEVQRGAKFKLTYEKIYDGNQFIRYGEVLRTELEVDDRNVVREYVNLKTGGIFYDPRMNYESRPFYAPVDKVSISSLFQPRRWHPIKHIIRAHEGIDFETAEGSNVYAAQNGTVIRMGRNRAAGNFVVIRHEDGLETYYNHMKAHVAILNVGDAVKNGQVIGYVGSTGYSTKPHLHFAVRRGGRFVDPIFLIRGYAYNQRDQITRMLAQVDKR
jgi:murein DD-endopeptidase MepM/ murein hydrolase activator NlpD